MTILDRLEAAEREATPGPWRVSDDWNAYGGIDSGPEGAGWIEPTGAYSESRADNELTVLLRNHAADLIAVARALERELGYTHGDDTIRRLRSALAPLLSSGDES